MSRTDKAYLNDNIRTEHLKCSSCRTQIFLVKIEPSGDGGELRTFGCPHCRQTRSLRLAPAQERGHGAPDAVAGDHGSV